VSRWIGLFVLAGVAGLLQHGPTVRGNDVTFVAAGDPADPPRIVADFNGWQGGEMTRSADGHTYTLTVMLDPAARIEYLIAYRDRFVLDPGNPLTVPSPAGPPRSEWRMPGYQPPAPLKPARYRGSVDDIPFESSRGERRRIRVYRPATTVQPLPVLYAHDGDIFVDALGLPSILDSLIDADEMAPAIVVFVDAVDRHADYEPGSPFRSVFTEEIVPMIERRYGVTNARRSLIGLSRSTVGALDACINTRLDFESCALLAPAVPHDDFARLLRAPRREMRFFVDTGTYDIPLVADARALRDELVRRGLPMRYHEAPEGHNHSAFRARLPALLGEMFPPYAKTRRPE
jgi:enterochelin esterase-like enzyme